MFPAPLDWAIEDVPTNWGGTLLQDGGLSAWGLSTGYF
jgi:hypothetical protein